MSNFAAIPSPWLKLPESRHAQSNNKVEIECKQDNIHAHSIAEVFQTDTVWLIYSEEMFDLSIFLHNRIQKRNGSVKQVDAE